MPTDGSREHGGETDAATSYADVPSVHAPCSAAILATAVPPATALPAADEPDAVRAVPPDRSTL